MKILLYGELWEGTIINNMVNVLKKKNIDFEVFDFFNIINYNTTSIYFNKISRKLFYKKNERLINILLIKKFNDYKPSIVFVSKGLNIYPDTINFFKKQSVILANWNPDDFFNPLNSNPNLLESVPLYDIVFSARKHLFNDYNTKGISNLFYTEWYYVPWLHNKPLITSEIKNVITFIGSVSVRREKILCHIDDKFNIEVWGSGWENSKINRKKNILNHNKELYQNDFPEIISRSLINLNSLTVDNRDMTNLKLFEITASYGLLLTEQSQTSLEILQKNKDCFYYDYNNLDNLNDTIAYIFKESNKYIINETKLNGYKTITNNSHSVEDRIDMVLSKLNTL